MSKELAIRSQQERRLLFVLHSTGAFGGTQEHTRELLERLPSQWTYRVLVPDGEDAVISDTTHTVEIPPDPTGYLELYGMPVGTERLRGSPSLANEFVEGRFRDHLRAFGPDIVHFQHLVGWRSLRLPAVAAEHEIPYVVTLHDFHLLCPDYFLVDADGIACQRNSAQGNDNACLSCVQRKWRGAAKWEKEDIADFLDTRNAQVRSILSNASALVCSGNTIRDKIAATHGTELAELIRVLPTGGPLEQRKSRNPNDGSSPLSVIVLGKFRQNKGREAVFGVAELLAGEMQITIIGGASDEDRRRGEAIGMSFRGRFERGDLPQMLADADVALVLSVVNESYCRVLTEVWSTGIVPIVSGTGALADRVINGVNGFIVPPNAPDKVVDLLRFLDDNRSILARVEENVRQLRFPTVAESMKLQIEIYETVLRGR